MDRSRSIALACAAAAVVGAVIVASMFVSAPRPDTILKPTGTEPDALVIALTNAEGLEMGIDSSTLRAFGSYRDVEVWSAVSTFRSPCLIAMYRGAERIAAHNCVPEGTDLFIDTMWHELSGGERLRFFLRGDEVSAFLLTPEAWH